MSIDRTYHDNNRVGTWHHAMDGSRPGKKGVKTSRDKNVKHEP